MRLYAGPYRDVRNSTDPMFLTLTFVSSFSLRALRSESDGWSSLLLPLTLLTIHLHNCDAVEFTFERKSAVFQELLVFQKSSPSGSGSPQGSEVS